MEGPKGASVEVESEKDNDKGVAPSPNENEPQEKRESEKPKESKTLPPKPYMPPLTFPQGLQKLSLALSLASFLICLKSYMLMFHS